MKFMDKTAMVKRLGKANRDIEAVHISVRGTSLMVEGHTVEEILTKLTHIRAYLSVVTDWLENH